MTSFKIFFGNENIRRFTIAPTSLESLHQFLVEHYSDCFHPEMVLQYTDSDGDNISVCSEIEWNELLQQFKDAPLIKLHVLDKNPGKYFKDGPKPEVVKLVEKTQEQAEIEHPIAPGFDTKVTQALENLFPSKKILPYNIPAFLKEAISFETLGDQLVDLQINFSKFRETLHTEALRLMESTDRKLLTQAKQLLQSQLILEPDNPVVLYNLACAESLLGNTKEAFLWLENAVKNGYSNLSHMLQDADLTLLRGKEEWNNLVINMKKALAPAPEVVPESVVVVPERVVAPEVQDQLIVLHEMGFLDDSVLIPALQQFGSVDAALADLLG